MLEVSGLTVSNGASLSPSPNRSFDNDDRNADDDEQHDAS